MINKFIRLRRKALSAIEVLFYLLLCIGVFSICTKVYNSFNGIRVETEIINCIVSKNPHESKYYTISFDTNNKKAEIKITEKYKSLVNEIRNKITSLGYENTVNDNTITVKLD